MKDSPRVGIMIEFLSTFKSLTGHPPFPWQVRLYEKFSNGEIPDTCIIPTGLGKTSVIAIWLIALANNHTLPKRLVYVVNRRTVVDQTTREVEKICENLPNVPELEAILSGFCALEHKDADGQPLPPLAMSTLRGEFADNQQWSADPARAAVICGTVDMIGSRLLFSGYRCGYKSKPMQAGFLGQDSLLVHDESHLEPAFQNLIEEIQAEQIACAKIFPQSDQRPLRVMALSATAKKKEDDQPDAKPPFVLDPKDNENQFVKQRIEATKELQLHPIAEERKELVAELVKHAVSFQDANSAVVVFARSVDTVEKVVDEIEKSLRGLNVKDWKNRVRVLTGTMRGLERNRLVDETLFKRFVHAAEYNEGEAPFDGTVYLVCTSAGEVGVNISADHLVCDLSTYESMAQRFGRVNRFGERNDTQVHVVHQTEFATEEETEKKPELTPDIARSRTLKLLQDLVDLGGSVSPVALGQLSEDAKQAAFSPIPTMLDTSDILFDAWANTSIKDLPGRPPVEEYLHGVAEWEPPRTEVAWREEVEKLSKEFLDQPGTSCDDLLGEYPLKPHETLSDRSDRIYDQLKKLYERIEKDFRKEHPDEVLPPIPVWLTSLDDKTEPTDLATLVNVDKKNFAARTIILPPNIGGLQGGLLTPNSEEADDVSHLWQNENDEQGMHHRFRRMGAGDNHKWRLIRSIHLKPYQADTESANFDEEPADADKFIWYWYTIPQLGDDDGSKAARDPIAWPLHTNDVVANAKKIAAKTLGDTLEIHDAMILAARFHDFGKRRKIWQRSIGNPNPEDWHEKSGKAQDWGRLIELTRYRHEFGSLLNLLHPKEEDIQDFTTAFSEFSEMNAEQQDIVLHLIAVHHGRGRPHFPIEEAFDPVYTQQAANELAREVPRRFARMQRRFGRWGLAWLESLFRAADYAASGNPTTTATEKNSTKKEVTA